MIIIIKANLIGQINILKFIIRSTLIFEDTILKEENYSILFEVNFLIHFFKKALINFMLFKYIEEINIL